MLPTLESSALSLTLDEFLNSSVEAGSVVKTPIATVVGNDGKATVSVVATLKDGDICYQLTKSENGYEFAPLYAGEYDIVYTCSDYVSCVTKSLSLTVSASDTPVMVDTPELPLVFVKGCEYTLPTMKGYLLDSGVPVESEMTVSYKFDGGQEVPCDGKMTVNANDYVSVVYTLGSYKKSFDVDVTDVGKDGQIIKKNYFYAPQFTATSDTEKTTYITSTEGATMTFIKPVLVSEFNLKFNIKNKNFEAMNVYLTDTVNIENVLKISLTSSPQGTQFYSVNGGNVQSVTKYLEGTDISLLYYNGEDYVLSGDESLNINGFSGFDSYMANLVIELVGVSGQSEIEIYEINNEVINSYDYDKFDAQYYCDITSGVKRLGDTLNIGRLFVADVLSFESSAYISVYDIDGNACVATDGTVMDKVSNIDREYSITLNGYGEYTVEIRYVDELMQLTSANKSKFKVDYVTVEVVDDVAPQITLGKIINQSGKGKITVATATASDNLDDDVSVYVYVTKPNQVTQKVVDGSFTADTTGVYIVSYYATDSTGNLGFTSYRIEVK